MSIRRRRTNPLIVTTVSILTVLASVLTVTPASASAVRTTGHCVGVQACDVVNSGRHFTNYSSVCSWQDCNFVSAADWERIVARVTPSPALLRYDYSNSNQTYGEGLDMSKLWSYWHANGIDGIVAEKVTPYSTGQVSTERAVSRLGALIVAVVVPRDELLGSLRLSPGEAIMVVDGYTPRGPLVVFESATYQMTWATWQSQAHTMWGITVRTVAPPSNPSTSSITFNANGGSGVMAVETAITGDATPITPDAFTLSGYSFSGWNTAANGSGTEYANGATYPFQSSVTLYAQWSTTSTGLTTVPGYTSSNWSGYILPTATPSTFVSGEWTVPMLNCAVTPNGYSTTWVGTGGVVWNSSSNSGPLLQTGVLYSCLDGVQSQNGWFELTPTFNNTMQNFANFPIAPGDTIQAFVSQDPSSGQWSTVLEDLTTGLEGTFVVGQGWWVSNISTGAVVGEVTPTSPLSYSGGTTMEWVQEELTDQTSGTLVPLADFNSVTFTHLEAGLTNSTLTSNDEWEMTNSQGDAVAIPTAVTNDSFTVSYVWNQATALLRSP